MMAFCKEIANLRSTQSTAFDIVLRPGTQVVYEGIYRCQECGMEMAAIGGKPLRPPPELPNSKCDHKHWKLLVALSR